MLSPVCCMRLFPTLLVPVLDPKVKPGPHADGIVGCASAKQISQLSINQYALGQATASSQPAQTANVLSV